MCIRDRVKPFFGFEQLQTRDLGNNHGIRLAEGLGQFLLENIAARGVAPRLEDGPNALVGVTQAQRAQGFADGRGMMPKIVQDSHAAGDAAHFHAPFDSLERVEAGLNLLVGQTAMFGAGDHGQGVAHINFADEVEMKLEAGDFKFAGRRAVTPVSYTHLDVYKRQVHQFVRIGAHAYVGGGTTITQDVLPFSMTSAARNTNAYGMNKVGLERRGFSLERIRKIHHAYKTLLASKMNTSQALEKLKSEGDRGEDVDMLIRFIEASDRGVIK